MTDHLDEAAAKAVDLAAAIGPVAKTTLEVEAAAHLAYMAGLLRGGGGGRRTEELSMFVPVSDEESKARVEVGGDGVIRTFDRSGQQVWPADEIPHDHLPWPVRQAVSAVLHACYEHEDPNVREAREQLYNAVTHGQVTDPTLETDGGTADPREAARNFRLSAEKVGGHVNPHGNTWASGVRHGYLMAADALDEVADTYERVRAQRDELLVAARKALAEQTPHAELDLDEVVTRLEREH